ncbi:predicted protein [Plenodomus lingam JN3]|uniref:Predicted protein n=1 Tax=Leptosphaeria maculans (strain JN3 / isolate v23.1.3 / race Av1-4-5-6-7-8) TaxID=985895 RepID=E4ZVA4_LEPMJ|nr:predicted protein [Plenodomus lingam JN3]CBX95530.1 predicted protein [Plenodomus lingam JN3]
MSCIQSSHVSNFLFITIIILPRLHYAIPSSSARYPTAPVGYIAAATATATAAITTTITNE